MQTVLTIVKYVLIALPFILNALGVANSEVISELVVNIIGYLGMAGGAIWAYFDETAGAAFKKAIEDILDEVGGSRNSSEVSEVSSYEAGKSKLQKVKSIALRAVGKRA